MIKLNFMILVFIIISCSNVDSRKPEALLKSFVNNSFEQKISSNQLDEYFTGPLLLELKNKSESDLKILFDIRGARLSNIDIFSRVCEEKTCYLTFSVTYKEEGQVVSATKKVAKIIEVSDQSWRIEEISHIKTFHQFKSFIEVIR